MSLNADVIQQPAPTVPRGLGRLHAPNPGSFAYPLRAALTRTALAPKNWRSKKWRLPPGEHFRNQSAADRPDRSQSTCVKYGTTHTVMMTPHYVRDAFTKSKDLYTWAQQNDPWPGEEPTYEGTSVDAGLQYWLKIAKAISEYRWARNMDDVLARLSALTKDGGGPVVVGTDFYQGMSNENGDGRWHPTGELWGGHCYVFIGHRTPTAKREGLIYTGNSHDGNYEGALSYDEAEWLVFAQNGEAAAITEIAA